MDNIKEAFQRVKEDIISLKKELDFLRQGVVETREKLIEVCEIIKKINEKTITDTSTHRQINSTLTTQNTTDNISFMGLKPQNILISTGNEGVPTDRQTNRQTDIPTQNLPEIKENPIENAAKILESLDSIKKEIRLKFKRLTEKELLIFLTIYQLEEETGQVDYKSISQRLNLTESSIRDYVGRLIKKGISVDKKKINNKTVQLSISPNLKKIASLSTILQLRDL